MFHVQTTDDVRVRVRKRKAAKVALPLPQLQLEHRASFTVLGPPQPWQRAGTSRKGVRYTQPETLRYERAIKTAAMSVHLHSDTWPKNLRYRLSVAAFFADQRRRDLDNVLKAVCDALNKVAYDDDSQVNVMYIERWVDTTHPRTVITIEVLP